MNEEEIVEELEGIVSIPKSWDWSDGDCIRFTEDLAKVLVSLDESQLAELSELISKVD